MINIIKENLNFVKQIIKLSKSELKKQYKGAALGPLWAIIKPGITIFVFWFAFEVGLRRHDPVNGIPFFVFLLVGMIPWFFMSEAILDGARSLRNNRHFITKMPFPMSTIMTYTVLAKVYTHLFLVLVGYLIILLFGIMPSIYNIQILFYLPMMYIYFTCFAWITGPLSAVSKDFENIVKSIIQAIFWLSGIIWDPYSINNGIIKSLLLLNPVTYFASGYRNTFLYKKWFFETPYETIGFLILLLLTGYVGSVVYRKLRKTIPDIL